ncbi:MAG TPA: hypothetical protein VF968_02740 [Actinomycetota bacterium]
MANDAVSVRAAYERFPVSVKGALLLRGADGLPHQVRIESARAAECAGRGERTIGIEPMVLEIAPTLDTFVPFEVSTMDLAAGWYRLECAVLVDGIASVLHPGRPFAIPWPRAAVRRGTATIGTKTGGVALESLECVGDSLRISFAADTVPALKLEIDGTTHPVLEIEFDRASGHGRVVGYPALRSQQRLTIEIRGSEPVEVSLP